MTRAPWCDEACFAEPAVHILQDGRMATLVDPPSPVDDPRTVGTDQFIFWTLPLDIVLQAVWYRAVGFGMIQMRLLSTLWDVLAIFAWNMLLESLGAGARLRLTALVLIAFDYSFVRCGSEGRMDMMSAALGFFGIAMFLRLHQGSYARCLRPPRWDSRSCGSQGGDSVGGILRLQLKPCARNLSGAGVRSSA
jgi:hypothetical protein